MNRELELTVRPEDVARFVRNLADWRTAELVEAGGTAAGAIRDEHEGRVAAATRLFEVSSTWTPGEALTFTADEPVERFVLSMTLDRVLGGLVEGAGALPVTDYDGLDESAAALAYWSKVARDFNAECDRLDDAELEGAVS